MSTNGEVGIGPVRRVMVGTDRSETAERAVRWAASFADRFGADLHVVQVILPRNPADTEFLYYVLCGADGHHKFALTLAEHNRNVDDCLG